MLVYRTVYSEGFFGRTEWQKWYTQNYGHHVVAIFGSLTSLTECVVDFMEYNIIYTHISSNMLISIPPGFVLEKHILYTVPVFYFIFYCCCPFPPGHFFRASSGELLGPWDWHWSQIWECESRHWSNQEIVGCTPTNVPLWEIPI